MLPNLSRLSFLLVVLAGFHALPAAQLPREHAWQQTLVEYLGTLKEEQFAINNTTFRVPADYAQAETDRIYRDWIVLGHLGREPPLAAFQADPKWFTRNSIEGDEIRIFPEPAALAWWIQFDFPGNPYAGSTAGKHRALVIAMVDMLILESAQREDPRNLKPDFMAANIGTWAYALRHCGDVLPPEVQAAYRQGLLHYLEPMLRLAPRDGNTNMDMRELATLAELDHVFHDDETLRQRLVSEARRILFGDPHRDPSTSDPRRGTFHPAGYIGEADGPETSYNGISLYHLAEAAMISRGQPAWDAFMPEVIRRMVRFKAYNTFPQPDGGYEGPSSWSKRTNAPYVRDQRDRPWRPFAEAMLTEEALYRLNIDAENYSGRSWGLADRQSMLNDIASGVQRLNRNARRPEGWRPDSPPAWKEDHWPADLPYTWDHYVAGSYDRFQEYVSKRSPLLKAPFARDEDFNIHFDNEFWTVKRNGWGFQVEAVPDMGRGYDVGGSGALAGGSLATFWTEKTGVIVLGRLPDKWNYVTWDKIGSWPTHHVWGRVVRATPPTGEANDPLPAFSSARQRNPFVQFNVSGPHPHIHVLGELGMDRTVQERGLLDAAHVFYRRRFALHPDGLRVESELLSMGTDQVSELWESIPIYLAGTRGHSEDTQLEFRVKDAWQPAGETLVDGVRAVRATRFGGAVVIGFDEPQRLRLSPLIQTAYQQRDRMRNIEIDLLGSADRPAAMPKRAAVNYTIRAGN